LLFVELNMRRIWAAQRFGQSGTKLKTMNAECLMTNE